MKYFILLCAFLPLHHAILSKIFKPFNEKMVKTIPQGKLRGVRMTSSYGKHFFAYMKIPYAVPPLGDLRFKSPLPAGNWNGVRDATKPSPGCNQKEVLIKFEKAITGQEDCLYLHVYTPDSNITKLQTLPVMVFIHGGALVEQIGNNIFYPPDYLMNHDIVLVTINYRLGALGFVSMEDADLPGNNGLKDQSLALRWVKDNIQYFGGNPNLVTIFGQSAGGVSVHYHMLSPMSTGLFQRAISQSGTIFTTWAESYPGYTKNRTIHLAELLGCPTKPTERLLKCLRSKPAADITAQQPKLMEWSLDPIDPYPPVVEKYARPGEAFLPERPEDIISSGRITDVPWIIGTVSADGALRVSEIYKHANLVQELNDNFEAIAPICFKLRKITTDPDLLAQKIRRHYFGDQLIGNDTRLKAVELWTDNMFIAGQEKSIRLHKEVMQSPIYYYWFNYRGTVSYSKLFGDASRDYGVTHTDDLIYLFPQNIQFPEHKLEYNSEDRQFIRILPQIWTDFARTGNPTPEGSLYGPWTPVETDAIEFFNMTQSYSLNMEKGLLPNRSAFWRDYFDSDAFKDETMELMFQKHKK